MFQQLLSDSCASIFCNFKLADPVVDALIKFAKGFFLFQQRFMREAGDAWRAKVCADALVEISAAGAEGAVGSAEIFASFVESTELLQIRESC